MNASVQRALAELKGVVSTIPNENILINTLGLQEAKDSSAIGNIITTQDDIYKTELNLDGFKSLNAKEVQNYIFALKKGFILIKEKGILINNDIIQIQSELEKNNAGFRRVPGTALKNATTRAYSDDKELLGIAKSVKSHIYRIEELICE